MNPKVELHIKGQGVVTLELDEQKAPKTVANFLNYVKKGHYDGTIFHRVIDGFMIQGGGFEPGMTQKPTDATIDNEANNGLKNDRYTVFGKVVSGMDVVNKIKAVPTGAGGPFPSDVPKTPVVITSATLAK